MAKQFHCPKHAVIFETETSQDLPTPEGHPDCPRCREEINEDKKKKALPEQEDD